MTDSPLRAALARVADGLDLPGDLARAAAGAMLDGEAPEGLVAAFLTAARIKGESPAELAALVEGVRARMIGLDWARDPGRPLLDTCGTGGDGASTVNVSTAAAIVVAAVGVPVAKHGNRAASGKSGSSEVLAELGVDLDADPPILRRCLDELGITFLHAPRFHPALKALAPIRRSLPFRTMFNLVGPLANPARPDRQLIGAPGDRAADLIAGALLELGVGRAAVVSGSDGLDEVTLAGPTSVRRVSAGSIERDEWTPADFGLATRPAAALRIDGPADGADRIRRLLAGEPGAVRDVVLANASAALLVAGRADTPRDGVALAAEAIDSGAASTLLGRWVELSSGRA